MNKPKYIQSTESGYSIVGNRGNRKLSISFKVANDLRLEHKYHKTVFHTANSWKFLSDSQRYKRVVSHWVESKDLRQNKDEIKSKYEQYWQYVDEQLEALNIIVHAYNESETGYQKRYFSRTEAFCKMLYPSFLEGEPINVKQFVQTSEEVES